MWVKICGITRLQDALLAESLGASAIGFVFTESPRQITIDKAATIARSVKIARVGVFVDASLESVQQIKDRCRLDIVQLHGNESPDFCNAVGGRVIKAFRLRDRTVLSQIKSYKGIWKILLDAHVTGMPGGTGRQIQSDLLHAVKDFSNIILAGGIGAGNVQAYRAYGPFGLDVSSSLESEPGIKERCKMEELFTQLNRF
jgi:phosphoribosylanthranilate isomerase